MNLYLLTQETKIGYDTYDSCVVAAESPEDAVTISPSSSFEKKEEHFHAFSGWARYPKEVTATELGKANGDVVRGVVIASYNAS
jgi:hypothetical protein